VEAGRRAGTEAGVAEAEAARRGGGADGMRRRNSSNSGVGDNGVAARRVVGLTASWGSASPA
jgi:hypothetical protein